MNKIEEAIKFGCAEIGYAFIEEYEPRVEFYRQAIQVLKEKAERKNPKPLIVVELKGTEYRPKYIVSLDESFKSTWNLGNANFGEKFYFNTYDYLRMSKYNKTWIAYNYELKEGSNVKL